MYNRMTVIGFIDRFEASAPGRRKLFIVRWPHEIVAEKRLLVITHELPLHERRQRRQAGAYLTNILPAILQESHREHVGRRRVHNASATDVHAVEKRADDAYEKQHAFAGASLIDVPKPWN